jgi:hypothetical protein
MGRGNAVVTVKLCSMHCRLRVLTEGTHGLCSQGCVQRMHAGSALWSDKKNSRLCCCSEGKKYNPFFELAKPQSTAERPIAQVRLGCSAQLAGNLTDKQSVDRACYSIHAGHCHSCSNMPCHDKVKEAR